MIPVDTEKKTEVIKVRCTPKTKERWLAVVAKHGLKESEAAMKTLLDLYEENKPIKGKVY